MGSEKELTQDYLGYLSQENKSRKEKEEFRKREGGGDVFLTARKNKVQ